MIPRVKEKVAIAAIYAAGAVAAVGMTAFAAAAIALPFVIWGTVLYCLYRVTMWLVGGA